MRCGDIDFPNNNPAPESGPTDRGETAVLGCSNTRQSLQGYLAASSKDLLMNPTSNSGSALGGMTLSDWADEAGTGWNLVVENEPNRGYTSAWVQLCLSKDQHKGSQITPLHQSQIRTVINKLKSRYSLQANQISVSPLQEYPRRRTCKIAGAGIFEVGQAIALYSKNNLGTVLGPELYIDKASDLRSDGCHLANSGITIIGKQLVEAFD